ncbi:AMP-binding protein [Nonomuraea sp. NPDC000554]|uniref:AMP-binding protein n=1 Tax=Nonomuraea sp. NPDC000554 TaxID=3154259 RepID=UPI003327FD36
MEYPAFTVHGLFERVAEQQGGADAIAVVHGAREVGYAELDRLANGVADWLLDVGVRPGTPIGLCLSRTPELFAAMLGVLKAGACYIPIDVADPDERLRHIAEQAGGIECFITDGSRQALQP